MHSLVDGKITYFQIVAIISSSLWTIVCSFQYKHMLFFLSLVKSWNCVVTLCLTFWITIRPLSSVTVPLTLLSAMFEDSSSSTFCQHYSFFFITAIHVIVELYITIFLIWIFLISSYAKHLFTYVHVIIGHLYIFREVAI